jgi:hypothetical protein
MNTKVALDTDEYHGSLMEMRQDDRFINYLSLLDADITCKIERITAAQLPAKRGDNVKRLVPCAELSVNGKACKKKWLITAKCNQQELCRRSGSNKPQNWKGLEVTLYADADVTFGAKKVGGIRIR